MTSAEMKIAREAAQAGGDIVARYFREGVFMRSKESYNLVSDADLESEQAIAGIIRAAFPGHEILGEESHKADLSAEHLWVIDPLDGTNNFAHGIDHFAISIGYYRAGVAQCGVIYNPIRGQWYAAERGKGATADGKPVAVSPAEKITEVLVGVGFYYDRGEMMQATLDAVGALFRREIHGIRRMGTAALDLVNVGMGKYGAYFEYKLEPWDFGAGLLFVEEAGGKVTTTAGDAVPMSQTDLLATNGKLHASILETVVKYRSRALQKS